MKLALVSQSYYPRFGGVTEHVAHTAAELRARGHEVTVVTGRPPGYRGTDPPDVVRVGTSILVPFQGAFVDLTIGPMLRRDLRALWRERTFDLVHVHQPLTPTLPLLTGETADAPVVGTFHAAGDDSRLFRLFRGPLDEHWRRLRGRIAVSTTARSFVERHFPGEYRIIPERRRRAALPSRRAAAPRARGRPAQRAVRRSARSAQGPAGAARRDSRACGASCPRRASSSSGRRSCARGSSAASPRREREHVLFAGAVPAAELPSWYASAHVVVSPALRNESFGIVLLEAMAAGRPVVASDIPGYRSVVATADDGVLVPPGDVRALADELARLLRDPARRLALAARGRARAESFGWDVVAARLEAYYDEVRAAAG